MPEVRWFTIDWRLSWCTSLSRTYPIGLSYVNAKLKQRNGGDLPPGDRIFRGVTPLIEILSPSFDTPPLAAEFIGR